MTQENAVTKTIKVQDVKYKTQEFMGLDKAVAELSSDRDSASAELSAVMEYYGQVKERCIAKPETYEERQSKRRTFRCHGVLRASQGEVHCQAGDLRGTPVKAPNFPLSWSITGKSRRGALPSRRLTRNASQSA